MNLTGRPVIEKPEKAEPRPDYLAALHGLPCIICESFGEQQLSPTTAHHWICGRGGNRKTPDSQAIPLCDGHHQGDFDTSKIAIHRDRQAWVEAYGEDNEYIEVVQDMLAHLNP